MRTRQRYSCGSSVPRVKRGTSDNRSRRTLPLPLREREKEGEGSHRTEVRNEDYLSNQTGMYGSVAVGFVT
jgi:hypothetical protein